MVTIQVKGAGRKIKEWVHGDVGHRCQVGRETIPVLENRIKFLNILDQKTVHKDLFKA